jgi:hypothetical protein
LFEEAAWIELRDSGIAPLVDTEMITTERARAEFLIGAWLLDKTWTPDGRGLMANLKPQMLRVVDVLGGGRFKNAVILPRRSSKTTTLWCVLLGRCWLNEGHQAGYTMLTTQKKTAERYRLDVYTPVVKQWPSEDTRPIKVYKGNGKEHVEFANGSWLGILSPDGDAFRSGAYDTLVADEGGAAKVEMADDVKSAVIPAFDTRPGSQFIVAGTAAKYRDGNPLWDLLNDPKAGKVRFTVADSVTDEQLSAWEPEEDHPEARVRELIEQMHPGVDSGLTTLAKIEENFGDLKLEQFAEEYLGLFGSVGASSGIFNQEKWALAGSGGEIPALLEVPRFTVAFAPHPDQRCVSIVAAWRDEDGKAVPDQLEWRQGIDWAAQKLLRIWLKYKVPIVYDGGSQVAQLIVETLNRGKQRPKLQPLTFVDVKKAASLVVDEVDRGNVLHYRQPEMDSAVQLAVKRKAGVNGWALGRDPKSLNDDITGAEAWSYAQLAYDLAKPKRAPRKARVVT